MCDRLEELADYCEAKVERARIRDETGKSFAERTTDKIINQERKDIAATHAASAEADIEDQQQLAADPDLPTPTEQEIENAGGEPSEAVQG